MLRVEAVIRVRRDYTVLNVLTYFTVILRQSMIFYSELSTVLNLQCRLILVRTVA